jgi:uncharacterized protein
MSTPVNINAILEKLYNALSEGDVETWVAMHTQDVALNVNGSTAVSGRTEGAQNVLENLLPLLFSRVQPGSKIGVNWKLMCADEKRAVVIFEGEAKNLDGEQYNNRYCQILEFNEEGLIKELWEFFDTALADNIVFKDNPSAPAGTGTFKY